jgi:hypothetical protein
MSHETNDPGLKAFEAALAALTPAAPRFDRDATLYRAGQAAARPRSWLWPGAASCFALLAGTFGLTLLLQAPPEPIIRFVQAPADEQRSQPPVHAAVDPPRYLRLRDRVVETGVDDLPSVPAYVSEPSPKIDDLLP